MISKRLFMTQLHY